MARIDQPKINKAIHVCLNRCSRKPEQLLPTIAEFLDGLRAGEGWNEDELRAVEKGVRKVLVFGVLDGATYPADATDKPRGNEPPGGSKSSKVSSA